MYPGSSGVKPSMICEATGDRVVYLGSVTQVFVEVPGGHRLQVSAGAAEGPPPGEGSEVAIHLPPDALRILADEP